jgi:hypothetical protein
MVLVLAGVLEVAIVSFIPLIRPVDFFSLVKSRVMDGVGVPKLGEVVGMGLRVRVGSIWEPYPVPAG